MKRFAPTILLATCVLSVSTIARAQTATGPRWETRDGDGGARQLCDTVKLRVGKDGANAKRAKGVYFAVRVTRTKETLVCDSLPYTFVWDTTKVAEGWHWLGIVRIDPTGVGSEKVVDSLKVYVRNNRETPIPEFSPSSASAPPPVPPKSVANGATPSTARLATARPGAAKPLASRRRARSRSPRVLTLPEIVAPEVVPATVGVSLAPLSVPRVSALYKSDRLVYLGLPDGGVAVWDEAAKRGSVVRIPGVSGPVRALAAGNGTIYWTAGESDRVYALRTKEKTVTVFDAGERIEQTGGEGEEGGADETVALPAPSPASEPWIERLAVLGKRVVLMGTSATRIWDGESGLKPLSDMLPAEVAETYSDALVQCYVGANPGTKDALLVFATPNSGGAGGSLHLWSGNAESLRGKWRDRGVIATGKDFFGVGTPEMAVTPFGMLVPERVEGFAGTSALQFAACTDSISAVTPQTIPLGVSGDYNATAPRSAETVSVGASGVWWAQNGVIFRADPFGITRECYMPWNGAGTAVTALLADKEGAFVATDKGVQRIVLGQPGESDGYGGYVRVPRGDDSA